MRKVCTNCAAVYWARWRNEPVTLCADCRDDVVLCAACGAVQRPPIDARQLTLFPLLHGAPRAPADAGASSEHYAAPPRVASQQAKRKYPYQ